MADRETSRITERELREAELQMTGRPPPSATGFIGFVPASPGFAAANGAAAVPVPTPSGSTEADGTAPPSSVRQGAVPPH
jgi:hypothetical protein